MRLDQENASSSRYYERVANYERKSGLIVITKSSGGKELKSFGEGTDGTACSSGLKEQASCEFFIKRL